MPAGARARRAADGVAVWRAPAEDEGGPSGGPQRAAVGLRGSPSGLVRVARQAPRAVQRQCGPESAGDAQPTATSKEPLGD